MPATGCVTANPASRSIAVSHCAAWRSCSPSSGVSWIRRLSETNTSRISSTVLRTLCFSAFRSSIWAHPCGTVASL